MTPAASSLPENKPRAAGSFLPELFESLLQAALQAEQAAGAIIEQTYRIAGHTLRLRFAGSALVEKITTALEHHPSQPGGRPELTVYVWDSASTHTPLPRLPWIEGAALPAGRPRLADRRPEKTFFIHQGDAQRNLSLIDLQRGLAVFCCRDAEKLPVYERGAPLRFILHWWFCQAGIQFMHGGAVGTPQGGVLLAGRGGIGKSTTTLACLQSELFYGSDDYCLVGAEPQPYAYNLYNTAKVKPGIIAHFPQLQALSANSNDLDGEKAIFFVHDHWPEKIIPGFPLRAILLPRITGRLETTLKPATYPESLGALALSTLRQLAGDTPASVRIIESIASRTPAYHLELGTRLEKIPQVIIDLLRKG